MVDAGCRRQSGRHSADSVDNAESSQGTVR